MEKTKKTISIIVLLLLSIILVACGEGPDNTNGEADANNDPIRIGVAMKTETQPRWEYDVKYMKERAKELNAELIIQWANDDITLQTNQVENLLTQGIDVLIIVPVTDQTGNLVEMAKSENVPVVAYDALPANSDVDAFITRDNYETGRLQIEAAIEYAGKDANFAILKGDPPTTVAQEIAQAYDDYIKEYDLNVVAEQWHPGWSTETALQTAENALSAQDDDIQAFITSNDGMALGVAQALRGRGLDGDVFVSGMDVEITAAQNIAEGTQTMSVWTLLDDQARVAIETAVDLANGNEIEADDYTDNEFKEVPTLFAEVIEVNANNLREYVTEIAPEGWMSEEEVFKE